MWGGSAQGPQGYAQQGFSPVGQGYAQPQGYPQQGAPGAWHGGAGAAAPGGGGGCAAPGLWAAVGVVALVNVALGALLWSRFSVVPAGLPQRSRLSLVPAGEQELLQYLAEAKELSLDCEKAVPIESAFGALAWCDSLLPLPSPECSFYSISHVNTRDDKAERQFMEYGCGIFEFTPVVWGTLGWKHNETKVQWVKIGLADQQGSIPGIGALDTLEALLAHFPNPAGGWRALRIDTLGTEWRALAVAPDSALGGFSSLIVRLYMVAEDDALLLAAVPERLALLRRLKTLFYVYHARTSDCSAEGLRPFPGRPGDSIPLYTELSMIRKTLVAGVPAGPFGDHPELDRCADAPMPELPLPELEPTARFS